MIRLQNFCCSCALLLLTSKAFSAPVPAFPTGPTDGKPMAEAKPMEGAENFLDVAYLPARLTGGWEDRWVKLNVHRPKGGGQRPCIVFVHGGGYGGGDKDGGYRGAGGPDRKAMEAALARGFTVVNVNYILGDGIHPRVIYDFRAAIRFLRANTEKYGIDPARIGAWGFSAGGWLISTAGYTTSDDVLVGTNQKASLPLAELFSAPGGAEANDQLAAPQRRNLLSKIAAERAFLLPFDDAQLSAEAGKQATGQPAFQSSRLAALAFDFSHHHGSISPDDPPTLTYAGANATSPLVDICKRAEVPLTVVKFTEEKYRDQPVLHVPALTSKVVVASGNEETDALSAVLDWFERVLVKEQRMTPPEFFPKQRVFRDAVQVSLVVPDARRTAIHYTLDGSPPTVKSPVYSGPLKLSETTTIKAVAIDSSGGMADIVPSPIATATFVRGTVPPAIVGPAKLPPGKVGQPYAVQFSTAEVAPKSAAENSLRWRLGGHLVSRPAKGNQPASGGYGLSLDETTGELTGTPTTPGNFTVQVQVGRAYGELGSSRAYVLTVEP